MNNHSCDPFGCKVDSSDGKPLHQLMFWAEEWQKVVWQDNQSHWFLGELDNLSSIESDQIGGEKKNKFGAGGGVKSAYLLWIHGRKQKDYILSFILSIMQKHLQIDQRLKERCSRLSRKPNEQCWYSAAGHPCWVIHLPPLKPNAPCILCTMGGKRLEFRSFGRDDAPLWFLWFPDVNTQNNKAWIMKKPSKGTARWHLFCPFSHRRTSKGATLNSIWKWAYSYVLSFVKISRNSSAFLHH